VHKFLVLMRYEDNKTKTSNLNKGCLNNILSKMKWKTIKIVNNKVMVVKAMMMFQLTKINYNNQALHNFVNVNPYNLKQIELNNDKLIL
jgi:hypothetical protein